MSHQNPNVGYVYINYKKLISKTMNSKTAVLSSNCYK